MRTEAQERSKSDIDS